MNNDIAAYIRTARLAKGMSDTEAANRIGVEISAYGDLEQHRDELLTTLPLRLVRRLCTELDIKASDLLNLDATQGEVLNLSRNYIISTQMTKYSMSVSRLADRLGFDESIISSMIKDADFLEEWPVDLIVNLSVELKINISTLLKIS